MTRDPRLPTPESAETQALLDALAAVLEPLARLAVARGVPFSALETMAKECFVRVAHASHADLPEHRRVSRISTTTGLSRREVTRIVQAPERPAPQRSLAAETFSRWMTERRWRDRRGRPLTLARTGPAPSFEALAQAVTRDVHPRSLLEELVRLGLATLDEAHDTVSLAQDAFVPRGDAVRMARLLGDNVGDHLAGAVANVLGDGHQHFEQAIYADGLSAESIEAFRALVKQQWQGLRQAMVPALQGLLDADEAAHRVQDRRVRIGLYTFDEPRREAAPGHSGGTADLPAGDGADAAPDGAPAPGLAAPPGRTGRDEPRERVDPDAAPGRRGRRRNDDPAPAPTRGPRRRPGRP